MPHNLYDWLRRVKAVEREHAATQLAMERLSISAERDPTILAGGLTARDLGHAMRNLEATYLIRLFAQFETGLRLFWLSAKGADPPARTRDLLDGVAATRRIPHDQLRTAQLVREYRNTLVHEREERTQPIGIAQARSYLCRFLSFLPPNW